jgi:hypothetical protein
MVMPRMIERGKPAPVVVPSPDGATPGIVPPCVACGSSAVTRVPTLLGDGSCAVVCLDGTECAPRYRRGATPESYAAALRGEMLAVAP